MGCVRRVRFGIFYIAALSYCLFPFASSKTAFAQSQYNINFSQYSIGTMYTNAAGAPLDFSSFVATGPNAGGITAFIYPAFTINLTNKPLVCNSPGLCAGNFLMQFSNPATNSVTLDMQLALDSSVGAAISFGQTAPGPNATSIALTFPGSSPGTVQVQSQDGSTNSPTILYSFQTNLIRTNLQRISFTLNPVASTFSLAINGVFLANNAPVGSTRPINLATISIGDIENLGIGGNGGIDNILLGAPLMPNISTIDLVGSNISVGLKTSSTLKYDIQTTGDMSSNQWSTISSNIPGSGTLTNLDCGAASGSQQFFRVGAHP